MNTTVKIDCRFGQLMQQHLKTVPGRKTDVKDAEWITELLRRGLLKASYIPSKEQRELRELAGYRKRRL